MAMAKFVKAVFTLEESAQRLAQTDIEVNGAPVNVPYRLLYDGQWYKVKIHRVRESSGEFCHHRLFIVRPEQVVSDVSAPAWDGENLLGDVTCKPA